MIVRFVYYKKSNKDKIMRYISFIPYVVFIYGKNEGLWEWWPAFFIAVALNGFLHMLLMKYY